MIEKSYLLFMEGNAMSIKIFLGSMSLRGAKRRSNLQGLLSPHFAQGFGSTLIGRSQQHLRGAILPTMMPNLHTLKKSN